ncbi:hypothetical protein [Ekhidna sp.]|uniref:hypothetical protein n=1 Tax=Ekhidna sp. TaxID=2608089 RepID=UPI003CCBC31A
MLLINFFLLLNGLTISDTVDVQIISACELEISEELSQEAELYFNHYDSIINLAKQTGKKDSVDRVGNSLTEILDHLTFPNILTFEIAAKLQFHLSNYDEQYNIELISCEQMEKLKNLDYQILLDQVSYFQLNETSSLTAKIKLTNLKTGQIKFDDFITVNSSDEHFKSDGISIIHSLNIELANRIVYGLL